MNRNYTKSLICLLVLCAITLSSCGIITLNTNDTQITTAPPETSGTPDTETDPPETVESAEPPAVIP